MSAAVTLPPDAAYRFSVVSRNHFSETIGAAIRAARKEAGLTQVALASRIGVRPAVLETAESGRGCSLLLMTVIAEALDTTIDALVPLEALP